MGEFSNGSAYPPGAYPSGGEASGKYKDQRAVSKTDETAGIGSGKRGEKQSMSTVPEPFRRSTGGFVRGVLIQWGWLVSQIALHQSGFLPMSLRWNSDRGNYGTMADCQVLGRGATHYFKVVIRFEGLIVG